jgi:hypothetical protein
MTPFEYAICSLVMLFCLLEGAKLDSPKISQLPPMYIFSVIFMTIVTVVALVNLFIQGVFHDI